MNKYWLLALGGNLETAQGGPEVTLRSAVAALNRTPVQLCAVSRFFITPCFPAGAGPDYVNAAVVVKTDLAAEVLLALVHEIEADFGRARTQRWGMRTLDIDLVGHGNDVGPDRATFEKWRTLPPEDQIRTTPDQLVLPHPRMQDRAFVLVPLADIARHWRHPVLGLTVGEMLRNLPEKDRNAVKPL